MLFHHLHQHLVSLHVSVSALVSTSISLFIFLYIHPRQKINLHIGLGVYVTLQDIQCCWNYFVWSMRSSPSRLWKWACMIKWYRAIRLFGFIASQPCQNAAFGTRRRLKGNATKHTQAIGDGKIVCEPRATTDICFMQWWWLSSRLSGG